MTTVTIDFSELEERLAAIRAEMGLEFADYGAWWDYKAQQLIRCKTCGAKPGQPCRNISRTYGTKLHRSRYNAMSECYNEWFAEHDHIRAQLREYDVMARAAAEPIFAAMSRWAVEISQKVSGV